MNEVIDAMFEKIAEKDEYIIRQGDDGDNFYVIQEYVLIRIFFEFSYINFLIKFLFSTEVFITHSSTRTTVSNY